MAETLLLVLAVCIDSFAAAFGFGIGRIKIPLLSAAVVSLVGGGILALSLFFGEFIGSFLSPALCKGISAALLLVLGGIVLSESLIKHLLRKAAGKKTFLFKVAGINLAVRLCLDETTADLDNSKILTVGEAFFLSAALSLDSLAVGFGMGLGISRPWSAVALTLIFGFIAVVSGCALGRSLSAHRKKLNLSWLNGAVLVVLAILQAV